MAQAQKALLPHGAFDRLATGFPSPKAGCLQDIGSHVVDANDTSVTHKVVNSILAL